MLCQLDQEGRELKDMNTVSGVVMKDVRSEHLFGIVAMDHEKSPSMCTRSKQRQYETEHHVCHMGKETKSRDENASSKRGQIQLMSIASDETKVGNKDEINKTKKILHESDSSEGNKCWMEKLRIRTSPRTLYHTIVGLNDDQKNMKMELKVMNGGIPITIQSIHNLLGLRRGGIDLLEMDEVDDSKNITTTWRKQFEKKKMRPKDIMKLIQSSGNVGFNFKLNFLEHIQHILIKMAVVVSSRLEAEIEIKDVMSKFPDDDEFKQYKKELDDMFNEGACNTTHDTDFSGLKDHSTLKKDGQPSLEIVLSQPRGVDYCDNKGITPPKFDLGISPIKQPEPLSMVWHEELEGPTLNTNSKGIERSPLMKRCNVQSSEDANDHQVERATRQELKLGDHLRSPELLFSTPNDMNLHRHATESLACTTTMYISVIDAWATLLNYEERETLS
ncbi:hypothetical protein Ccrd_010094 [Cynara cardunculus var. scolymus]|uniref:Uncharacterized protein n=1 Tax=Cynara cardunculus var. scolymus TaxID=59895 RepID=A0A103YLR9_CYNCS|nr:hypothetical protein Ccrd_010094 [Cynara cardunculus var. scolymus]